MSTQAASASAHSSTPSNPHSNQQRQQQQEHHALAHEVGQQAVGGTHIEVEDPQKQRRAQHGDEQAGISRCTLGEDGFHGGGSRWVIGAVELTA